MLVTTTIWEYTRVLAHTHIYVERERERERNIVMIVGLFEDTTGRWEMEQEC
jgi:hypothetical protein